MGHGKEHARKRSALLPLAYGTVCPFHHSQPGPTVDTCTGTMRRGEALDLDHSKPWSLGGARVGDRITHASCNRSWGNGTRGRRPASVGDPGPPPGW